MGCLTTHVLDLAHGRPAEDVRIELWRIGDEDDRQLLCATRTNRNGRTETPLLEGEALVVGTYELVFCVGVYFHDLGTVAGAFPFLDRVPVRIGIADASAHYHVPLLVSPWAYSTYRGS